MGTWQPLSNLKLRASHNPPAATFFFCLLTLAISLICLSFYSETHTLPNPDTTKDWNHLLFSLSQLYLCVKTNSSSFLDRSSFPLALEQKKNQASTSNGFSVTLENLRVPLAITTSLTSNQLKEFSFSTVISARQLHLGDEETANLTMQITSGVNKSTCLTISAPAHLLPTSLPPPQCLTSEKNITTTFVVASNQLPKASQTCFSLHSKDDPTLVTMLTKEEQRVAVRHLLEVSVCLLGVCLILCVAASLINSNTAMSP
ncbi:Transmembrane protein 248 [Oryzias melastigma]|uniref:Transmembrane protein 248 n=1 Tax=Oryzias melastigma TaxID=30732 RepID=A0A834CMP2_ORYME|nr:Transmembrane protein 248 [Oryzias melastigma]